ncbi:SIMPL domain-containing protein [Actinobacillus genomosp. 2]|uniref:SIMPL domain-containing protein n=1 Tax=Actinobacillus genomosp. 2 TaxID=230709 RepID=UPI0024422DF7|nr:SIMPL domain-containing protein [Actinobacillus genomosp. 2]WGE31902.1 SIMPL domain-containing protein [Actinobacillus genomosp. 2]
MKFLKTLLILPVMFTNSVIASEVISDKDLTAGTHFEFSTEVRREVDKDMMQVSLFSRKTGKSLPELKKAVSANLNQVLESAKQYSTIQIEADGIRNLVNYTHDGKVNGWLAEGRIYLKSKDFDSMAKILENLGTDIAIDNIYFSVSPEKMASLEDEMTLEIIKQFQHKASVIQKGLNLKSYRLTNVKLDTPNGEEPYLQARPLVAMAKSAESLDQAPLALEAGKATISARASGQITFE